MPKVGFYAVRVGKEIGIYNTWDECKNQTHGYPNARYKRFNTLKDAENFVYGNISSTPPGVVSVAKGKKRAYAEIEDESGWDVVYSDGACKGNGNVGSVAGIGVWWGQGDSRNIAERCPGDQTNNRAELVAILRVLETTPLSKKPLLIKTDSQYSINCFKKWIDRWKKNGWKGATGGEVKNQGIIRCIDSHLAIRSKSGQIVHLQFVKGHSGDAGNDGADSLANEGTLEPPVQDRDWEGLHAQLVERLDSIDPNSSSNTLLEAQASADEAEPIPLELHAKSRTLGETGIPSHPQLSANFVAETAGTSIACHDMPAELRSGGAWSEQSRRLDIPSSSPSKAKSLGSLAIPTEHREVSSIQIPTGIPADSRVVGFAQKPVATISESQKMKRTGMLPPRSADESIQRLSSTAQFLEGPSRPSAQAFHADSSSQSPVKVLYAAPPLVPVPMEDVNFEDYADCLLSDADLALELSD